MNFEFNSNDNSKQNISINQKCKGIDCACCLDTECRQWEKSYIAKYIPYTDYEVEAIRFTGENFTECCNFMNNPPIVTISKEFRKIYIRVPYSKNEMECCEGDYIIKNSKGNFYPLKEHIFDDIFKEKGE